MRTKTSLHLSGVARQTPATLKGVDRNAGALSLAAEVQLKASFSYFLLSEGERMGRVEINIPESIHFFFLFFFVDLCETCRVTPDRS